ncbi:hypothetical protein PFISCL1PPCAC_7048, partial [Pristionchus fissidentatus]
SDSTLVAQNLSCGPYCTSPYGCPFVRQPLLQQPEMFTATAAPSDAAHTAAASAHEQQIPSLNPVQTYNDGHTKYTPHAESTDELAFRMDECMISEEEKLNGEEKVCLQMEA